MSDTTHRSLSHGTLFPRTQVCPHLQPQYKTPKSWLGHGDRLWDLSPWRSNPNSPLWSLRPLAPPTAALSLYLGTWLHRDPGSPGAAYFPILPQLRTPTQLSTSALCIPIPHHIHLGSPCAPTNHPVAFQTLPLPTKSVYIAPSYRAIRQFILPFFFSSFHFSILTQRLAQKMLCFWKWRKDFWETQKEGLVHKNTTSEHDTVSSSL